MFFKRNQVFCFLFLAFFLFFCSLALSATAGEISSSITEAEGNACVTKKTSREKTKEAALIDAKKKALANVLTYLESSTKVKNYVLEKDEVDAYTRGTVQVLKKKDLGWKKEGEEKCFSVWIQAEVQPDPSFGSAAKTMLRLEDPSKPLTVRAWTDKEKYKKGEKMRVFLKGNKPFHARLAYRDAGGNLLQLLPNPYRKQSHFEGGVTYQVPAAGDRFELEVSPPFGSERLVLYASTQPLGDVPLTAADSVFVVKTNIKDLGVRTRGITIKKKDTNQPSGPAEFSEYSLDITTSR